eukprot:CAMPEP_0180174032 /NCGR_PEP_ID=MMETSP0986-20121125/35912_1 /TAXON_ID=697907 /ORGANISM="non described non described, Strain CCMP2293" /LENGTH=188 /DNA_ID=CAMNT_0022126299 /DNA_START=73 /DNA_END=635 /DNA_ORIENTATION=-
MRRLGAGLLVCSALAVVVTLHLGKEKKRNELFLHAGRTAYGPDGHYSPKTGRYPVDKSALAAYLRHQPKERLDRLASRRQKVEDRRLERDSQPKREGAERRWVPDGAMGNLKRKSPGGSAAVRDAMEQYMQHQSEGARRREAIGETTVANDRGRRERGKREQRERHERLGRLHAESLRHRSRVQQVAL